MKRLSGVVGIVAYQRMKLKAAESQRLRSVSVADGVGGQVMVRIQNAGGSRSSEEMGTSGLLHRRTLSDFLAKDKAKEVDHQGFDCSVADIEAGAGDAGCSSGEKRMNERTESFEFGIQRNRRMEVTEAESWVDPGMDVGKLSFHGRASDWAPYSPGKKLSQKNLSPVSETPQQRSTASSRAIASQQNLISQLQHQSSSPKDVFREEHSAGEGGVASEQNAAITATSSPKDPSQTPEEGDAVVAETQRHSFQRPKNPINAGTSSASSSPDRRVDATQEVGVWQRRGSASAREDDSPPKMSQSQEPVRTPTRLISAPTLSRLKSKSRLEEPAPPPLVARQRTLPKAEQASPRKSFPISSPHIHSPETANKMDEEEDDPLKDADLPAKYRKGKLNLWSILELSTFLVIMAALLCSLLVPYLRRRLLWGLGLWRWVVLVMVVCSGLLLSGWAIRILVFFVERNFLLRKRVLYFVYGLRKGVQTCLWMIFVLLSWRFLFDPKVEGSTQNHRALKYVAKVLVCFVVAAFIWLAKILLVKVLALSYHVSTYFDRIQESLFNQYLLESLSGPPLIKVQQNLHEKKLQSALKEAGAKATSTPDNPIRPNAVLTRSAFTGRRSQKSKLKSGGKSGEGEMDDNITIKHLQNLNQRNISAWNMKRLINVVKQTGISTLTQALDEAEDDAQSKAFEIQSEWQAKAAAKQIFKNVAKTGMKYIALDDLTHFLPEDQASKAMNLFDGVKDSGRISKHALETWVVNVYKERKSLALSLNDTRTAVNKLHRILDIVVSSLIIIIWLLVLGLATTHLFVFISSQLLVIVFIFGNTCKTVFEAIIFLFAIHPFDVGDRCIVDGVQMVVEEMNILTTVFLCHDNEKIYYPNSVLATKPISNFYRSPDMGDAFEFSVHLSTPLEKIAALKEKIASYLESKPHHWYASFTLIVKEIESMNKMRMALGVRHTMNHQNAGEKLIRRSDLILDMKKYFEELGIEYHLLPRDISVRHI